MSNVPDVTFDNGICTLPEHRHEPFTSIDRMIAAITVLRAYHADVDGYCARCATPAPCATIELMDRELMKGAM